MKWSAGLGLLVLGIVVGGGAVILVLAQLAGWTDAGAHFGFSRKDVATLPTQALARRMLGDGAGTFVGDDRFVAREFPTRSDGVAFFQTPFAVGDTGLCAMRAYGVAIVASRLALPGAAPLLRARGPRVSKVFAVDAALPRAHDVWPTGKASATQEQTCARFRDFGHVFTVDTEGAPASADEAIAIHGVYVLDRVRAQMRGGALTATCRDRDPQDRPCDAAALIANLPPERLWFLKRIETPSVPNEDRQAKGDYFFEYQETPITVAGHTYDRISKLTVHIAPGADPDHPRPVGAYVERTIIP
jgi:hypothetical protein